MSTPDLQRRHFRFIAEVLADIRIMMPDLSDEQYERLIMHFAEKLEHTNPSFNLLLFYKAARGTT